MQNFLSTKREKTFDSSLTEKNDPVLDKITENYEKKIIKTLVNLYNNLSNEKINLNEIKSSVDILSKLSNISQYDYLRSLMNPEKAKGSKIPSAIPVPSCSFQLHNTITLTTNNLGNVCAVFNPSFLYDVNLNNAEIRFDFLYRISQISSLFVANQSDLTGTSPATFFPVSISQGIPPVYKSYRIVSASLVARYIGRLDQSSGVLGGAIVYDNFNLPGAMIRDVEIGLEAYSENPNLRKYGNFDLCNDAFYNQEVNILEGIREIYFPIDNSYEEYKHLTNKETIYVSNEDRRQFSINDPGLNNKNFNFLVYALGAPPNSSCVKLDIYVNFECLPDSSFLNYMPVTTSISNINEQDKTEIIKEVQKTPITSIKEAPIVSKAEPSFFERLISKIGTYLPSITKIIGSGIIGGITGGPAGVIAGITGTTAPLLLGSSDDIVNEVD